MAEITSVESVRLKLREFDDRMSDAIGAARALAAARERAMKLLGEVDKLADRGAKEIKSLTALKSALRDSQKDWTALNQELIQSLAESREERKKLEESRASAIRSIDAKLAKAEERLLSATEMRFTKQQEMLTRLDADTRLNAQSAENASATADKHVDHLQQLLLSLRTDLQREITTEAARRGQLLDDRFKELQNDSDQKVRSSSLMLDARLASNEEYTRMEASALRSEQQHFLAGIDNHMNAVLDSMQEQSSSREDARQAQMVAFKEEIAGSLRDQNETMSQQLTNFLNKQNTLVQNLTQQIDGFQRAASAQATAVGEVRSKVVELTTALRHCQDTAAYQFETTKTQFAAIRGVADEMKIALQRETQSGQVLSQRLEETLKKLKKLPFVGSGF
jgi:small nuclear ribonucleoprotein (snRNP)-like protein